VDDLDRASLASFSNAENLTLSDKGCNSARSDGLTALIDDETAVCIAIKGQADVRTVCDYSSLKIDQVGGI
jgi:hypothetical protein